MKRAAGPENRISTLTRLLLTCWGLTALGSSGWAQSSLTLAWAPSTDSTVIGYSLYQGGTSQNYTNVISVGTNTSATVSNLIAGATYYFAVTAYNAVGLESPFSNEIFYTVPQTIVGGPIAVVTFAADSGTITAPFTAIGGIMSQPFQTTLATGGRAAYTFSLTNSGSYTVSAMVNAPSDAQNSFYMNIDAEPTDPLMTWDIQPPTTGFVNRTVIWRGNGTDTTPQFSPKVFSLSAGTHQLVVRGREASVQLSALSLLPYLGITTCARLATGNRTITGQGMANQSCVLLAASSLTAPVTWTSIATNLADAQGLFSCNDLKATNFVSRFYRIQGR